MLPRLDAEQCWSGGPPQPSNFRYRALRLSPTHSALRANVDRLVLGTRVVLAGIVLAAVSIKSPARPGAEFVVSAALTAYLAFAIALLARATRALDHSRVLARAELVADVLLAAFLLAAFLLVAHRQQH